VFAAKAAPTIGVIALSFEPVTVGGGLRWQSGFYGNIYSPIANDYTRIKQGG